MFIGKYELEGKVYNNIYYGHCGWDLWHKDTFSPYCENIELLGFRLHGKTYQERKGSLKDIAIEWSNNFSQYSWSWNEMAEICSYFYENGKRYGLLKEFKENGIC